MAVRMTQHLPETRIQPGHFSELQDALASSGCRCATQKKRPYQGRLWFNHQEKQVIQALLQRQDQGTKTAHRPHLPASES